MHDYWNDPPEGPEPPACPDAPKCDGAGEYLYAGKTGMVFSCDVCGYQWVIEYPQEPDEPEPNEPWPPENEDPPEEENCPHGNKWGDCGACDYEGDLAYDAARERRLF